MKVRCALAAIATLSCVGTPTPLAPNFAGSVGFPHEGVQTDAIELPPKGVGFARYRPYGRAYWGQPRLIRAIERVAARVARELPGGPPLVLGDLSGKHGGKIPRHNSHRTGRDVDLLWYLQTTNGRPIAARGFVQVGADGLTRNPSDGVFYRLDIPRQWLAIKAFLELSDTHIQWMFCSRNVEALLINYAISLGEPDAIVYRAQNVLLQPGDSLPHDDHIHLRLACSEAELLGGCHGGGPHWQWVPDPPRLSRLTDKDLLEIGQSDPLGVDDEGAIPSG